MVNKIAFSFFILEAIFFVGVHNIKIENGTQLSNNSSIEIDPINLKIVNIRDCSIFYKIISKNYLKLIY